MEPPLVVLGIVFVIVLIAGIFSMGRPQPPVIVVVPGAQPPNNNALGCLLFLFIALLLLALLRFI